VVTERIRRPQDGLDFTPIEQVDRRGAKPSIRIQEPVQLDERTPFVKPPQDFLQVLSNARAGELEGREPEMTLWIHDREEPAADPLLVHCLCGDLEVGGDLLRRQGAAGGLQILLDHLPAALDCPKALGALLSQSVRLAGRNGPNGLGAVVR